MYEEYMLLMVIRMRIAITLLQYECNLKYSIFKNRDRYQYIIILGEEVLQKYQRKLVKLLIKESCIDNIGALRRYMDDIKTLKRSLLEFKSINQIVFTHGKIYLRILKK